MGPFEQDEGEGNDDEDVKLDAWMWWVIAIGTLISSVATFFVVRAIANLL